MVIGATEDISASQYTNTNIYFLGSDVTIPYLAIGVGNANNSLLCSINPNIGDPITGSVAAGGQAMERIALCLAFRYMNGLWDMNYTEAHRIVNDGVNFTTATTCTYLNGGNVSANACAVISEFLNAILSIKARTFPGITISAASSTQLKYFGNAVTQYYINKIMLNLAYRNAGFPGGDGENELFSAILDSVYPEITDPVFKRSLYPREYNYVGSGEKFGGTRSRPFPNGSINHTYTGP